MSANQSESTNEPHIVNAITNTDDDNICVICLEDLNKGEPIHFHCGHVFHVYCIFDWTCSLFQKNADISCPVCRNVECHHHAPNYIELRRIVGLSEVQYSQTPIRNNEVFIRVHDNQTIGHQDIQQQQEDGLYRIFLKFVVFLTIVGIAFLCFLIYTIANR